MRVRCMGSMTAVCLLGVALLAVPAQAQAPEGMYGVCLRSIDDELQDAMVSTAYAKRLDNDTLYTDVTGDDWPTLDSNVARFADFVPPGTLVPHGYYYKMMARKLYGDVIWESPWTDTLDYYNGAYYSRNLIMVCTGQGQK